MGWSSKYGFWNHHWNWNQRWPCFHEKSVGNGDRWAERFWRCDYLYPREGRELLRYFFLDVFFFSRWWFQTFFMFIPTWGDDLIWWAYFSDGLVQPPTSFCWYMTRIHTLIYFEPSCGFWARIGGKNQKHSARCSAGRIPNVSFFWNQK